MRTAMDAGPPKVRRRFTANWESWTILLRVTRLQLETLNAFHRTTLQAGALAFQWKHPETGNQIDMRFKGAPQKKSNAPRNAGKTDVWDVEFEVETIPGTEVTGSEPPPDPPPDPFVPMFMLAFDPPAGEDADGGPGEFSFTLIREAVAPEPDVYVGLYLLPFDPTTDEDAEGGGALTPELVPGGNDTGLLPAKGTGDTGGGGGGESSS